MYSFKLICANKPAKKRKNHSKIVLTKYSTKTPDKVFLKSIYYRQFVRKIQLFNIFSKNFHSLAGKEFNSIKLFRKLKHTTQKKRIFNPLL